MFSERMDNSSAQCNEAPVFTLFTHYASSIHDFFSHRTDVPDDRPRTSRVLHQTLKHLKHILLTIVKVIKPQPYELQVAFARSTLIRFKQDEFYIIQDSRFF